MKWLWLLWTVTLAAADAGAAAGGTDDAAAPSGTGTATRPALLGGWEDREPELYAADPRDRYIWLDESGRRGLLVHRPARGRAARGALLLLAPSERGAGGASFSARLRAALADYGWHTYLLGFPALAPEPEQTTRFDGALTRLNASEGVRLILAEGAAAAWLAARAEALTVDGVVLLNLTPPYDREREPPLLGAMEIPTLILQLAPVRWSGDRMLGPGVELHLLPKTVPARAEGLVLRRFRGWFSRRLETRPVPEPAPP